MALMLELPKRDVRARKLAEPAAGPLLRPVPVFVIPELRELRLQEASRSRIGK
jgi:hypothetical protein